MRAYLPLAVAVALGAALRLVVLGAHSLLLDEAFVAVGARDILRNHTAMWDAISNAPFVWLLVHAIGLGGLANPALLRLPAALAGAASIVPLYYLARRLFDSRVAIVAAFLLALHPFAVAFSRVLFADPFQIFFILCGFLAFEFYAKREERSHSSLLLVAIVWSAAFAMKYNAVVPGALWLIACSAAGRYTWRRAFFALLAMTAGSIAALLVWPLDAPIWLAAFLEKTANYSVAASYNYYTAKAHLVFFSLTEVMLLGGLLAGFARHRFNREILASSLFLIFYLTTVILLGRTFERYLLASVPVACILIAALTVFVADWIRQLKRGWLSATAVMATFVIAVLLLGGMARVYLHYWNYLTNDFDVESLARDARTLERANPDSHGYWLISEPIGAYYLGFSQHYSRSSGVSAGDPFAACNWFEFSAAPYNAEAVPYNVLRARQLAHQWGLWRIVSSPLRFTDRVRSIRDSDREAWHSRSIKSLDYMASDSIHPGDLLIMQCGTHDLLGEPILEQLDSTFLPPTFDRLPLSRFGVWRCYRPGGTTPNDTTMTRLRAGAWILVRKSATLVESSTARGR